MAAWYFLKAEDVEYPIGRHRIFLDIEQAAVVPKSQLQNSTLGRDMHFHVFTEIIARNIVFNLESIAIAIRKHPNNCNTVGGQAGKNLLQDGEAHRRSIVLEDETGVPKIVTEAGIRSEGVTCRNWILDSPDEAAYCAASAMFDVMRKAVLRAERCNMEASFLLL